MHEAIGYLFTAAANSGDKETVYEPPEGKVFELKEARAYTFSATAAGLSLSILYGESRVIPKEGKLFLSNNPLEAPGGAEYESGAPVVVDWENTEGTSYEVFVLLVGELRG